jgi:predicted transcriptional regulator
MTIQLPKNVEEELRSLATRQGRSIAVLLEEAVEQYLEAAAITDTTPSEVAATQEALLGELTNTPEWGAEGT